MNYTTYVILQDSLFNVETQGHIDVQDGDFQETAELAAERWFIRLTMKTQPLIWRGVSTSSAIGEFLKKTKFFLERILRLCYERWRKTLISP